MDEGTSGSLEDALNSLFSKKLAQNKSARNRLVKTSNALWGGKSRVSQQNLPFVFVPVAGRCPSTVFGPKSKMIDFVDFSVEDFEELERCERVNERIDEQSVTEEKRHTVEEANFVSLSEFEEAADPVTEDILRMLDDFEQNPAPRTVISLQDDEREVIGICEAGDPFPNSFYENNTKFGVDCVDLADKSWKLDRFCLEKENAKNERHSTRNISCKQTISKDDFVDCAFPSDPLQLFEKLKSFSDDLIRKRRQQRQQSSFCMEDLSPPLDPEPKCVKRRKVPLSNALNEAGYSRPVKPKTETKKETNGPEKDVKPSNVSRALTDVSLSSSIDRSQSQLSSSTKRSSVEKAEERRKVNERIKLSEMKKYRERHDKFRRINKVHEENRGCKEARTIAMQGVNGSRKRSHSQERDKRTDQKKDSEKEREILKKKELMTAKKTTDVFSGKLIDELFEKSTKPTKKCRIVPQKSSTSPVYNGLPVCDPLSLVPEKAHVTPVGKDIPQTVKTRNDVTVSRKAPEHNTSGKLMVSHATLRVPSTSFVPFAFKNKETNENSIDSAQISSKDSIGNSIWNVEADDVIGEPTTKKSRVVILSDGTDLTEVNMECEDVEEDFISSSCATTPGTDTSSSLYNRLYSHKHVKRKDRSYAPQTTFKFKDTDFVQDDVLWNPLNEELIEIAENDTGITLRPPVDRRKAIIDLEELERDNTLRMASVHHKEQKGPSHREWKLKLVQTPPAYPYLYYHHGLLPPAGEREERLAKNLSAKANSSHNGSRKKTVIMDSQLMGIERRHGLVVGGFSKPKEREMSTSPSDVSWPSMDGEQSETVDIKPVPWLHLRKSQPSTSSDYREPIQFITLDDSDCEYDLDNDDTSSETSAVELTATALRGLRAKRVSFSMQTDIARNNNRIIELEAFVEPDCSKKPSREKIVEWEEIRAELAPMAGIRTKAESILTPYYPDEKKTVTPAITAESQMINNRKREHFHYMTHGDILMGDEKTQYKLYWPWVTGRCQAATKSISLTAADCNGGQWWPVLQPYDATSLDDMAATSHSANQLPCLTAYSYAKKQLLLCDGAPERNFHLNRYKKALNDRTAGRRSDVERFRHRIGYLPTSRQTISKEDARTLQLANQEKEKELLEFFEDHSGFEDICTEPSQQAQVSKNISGLVNCYILDDYNSKKLGGKRNCINIPLDWVDSCERQYIPMNDRRGVLCSLVNAQQKIIQDTISKMCDRPSDNRNEETFTIHKSAINAIFYHQSEHIFKNEQPLEMFDKNRVHFHARDMKMAQLMQRRGAIVPLKEIEGLVRFRQFEYAHWPLIYDSLQSLCSKFPMVCQILDRRGIFHDSIVTAFNQVAIQESRTFAYFAYESRRDQVQHERQRFAYSTLV